MFLAFHSFSESYNKNSFIAEIDILVLKLLGFETFVNFFRVSVSTAVSAACEVLRIYKSIAKITTDPRVEFIS